MVVALSGCSALSSLQNGSDNLGTIIIEVETVPVGQEAEFLFTGVPSGSVATGESLVVSEIEPGTYTTAQVDPAPDFDLDSVLCDDQESERPSDGDAKTRAAVINVEPGETVTCTFTNAQRGSVAIAIETIPKDAGGTFEFTGVPNGTASYKRELVFTNIKAGTYSSTERDVDDGFDLTHVDCADESESSYRSFGDASTRTAIFNLDPGETVRCTFTQTQRGSLVLRAETSPPMTPGKFEFTGIHEGEICTNGNLRVDNLRPGEYTSGELDVAPYFELTSVECNDGDSNNPSYGDATARSVVMSLDPGETVTCTFSHRSIGGAPAEKACNTVLPFSNGNDGDGESRTDGTNAVNPFSDPETYLPDFPIPDELHPEAGEHAAPRSGPWSLLHFEGEMACGSMTLAIPPRSPENGVLEIQSGGQIIIGTGYSASSSASITMTADPEIIGRYAGSFQGAEQGAPGTVSYYWQVVTDQYIIGYLTSSVTNQGITCDVYKPFEMRYQRSP